MDKDKEVHLELENAKDRTRKLQNPIKNLHNPLAGITGEPSSSVRHIDSHRSNKYKDI